MNIHTVVYFVFLDLANYPVKIIRAEYRYDNEGGWSLVAQSEPNPAYRLPRRIVDFRKYRCVVSIAEWRNNPSVCKCGKPDCTVNSRIKELAMQVK